MAEKDGWPLPLFSHVQRYAIHRNVILLEGAAAPTNFCLGHLTLQQVYVSDLHSGGSVSQMVTLSGITTHGCLLRTK